MGDYTIMYTMNGMMNTQCYLFQVVVSVTPSEAWTTKTARRLMVRGHSFSEISYAMQSSLSCNRPPSVTLSHFKVCFTFILLLSLSNIGYSYL